jgi:hypothetical protein
LLFFTLDNNKKKTTAWASLNQRTATSVVAGDLNSKSVFWREHFSVKMVINMTHVYNTFLAAANKALNSFWQQIAVFSIG